MHDVILSAPDDFDGWRDAARALAGAKVAADRIAWRVEGEAGDLFAGGAPLPVAAPFSVPRLFVELAQSAICHRDPERFALLYMLLARLRGDPRLIHDHADPLVRRLGDMASAVRRDIHKMRVFVRFRDLDGRYVAWFESEHHIVRANAVFFVRRFANMCWSILTPALSIHWDGETLTESPGAAKSDAPGGDPKSREGMGGNSAIALDALREEATGCTRCHLYKHATQTVFGEGPADAPLMLVGEQPGDQEDLAGRPFVGPAGQRLDEALAEAGIDRTRAYVTNAVKHFKFERRGKRRIHSKPGAGEIEACRWWIEQERTIIAPKITVALGATAARSLFGRVVTIGRERGRAMELPEGGEAWITIHPSFLLRIQDAREAADEYRRFVEELTTIRKRVDSLTG